MSLENGGILLAKFPTPLTDGLIGDDDAAHKEPLFDIPIAEAEPEIQPDTVADNLGWEAVVLIAVRCGWSIHTASMPQWGGFQQVDRALLWLHVDDYFDLAKGLDLGCIHRWVSITRLNILETTDYTNVMIWRY